MTWPTYLPHQLRAVIVDLSFLSNDLVSVPLVTLESVSSKAKQSSRFRQLFAPCLQPCSVATPCPASEKVLQAARALFEMLKVTKSRYTGYEFAFGFCQEYTVAKSSASSFSYRLSMSVSLF